MLHNQSLFFCRADELSDRFEGSYTALSIQRFEGSAKEVVKSFKDNPVAVKNINDSIEALSSHRRQERERAAINCWHRNERESAAMWSLYLKSEEGIAVVSTYERLCDSMHASQSKVMIGVVEWRRNRRGVAGRHRHADAELDRRRRDDARRAESASR
ncbi:hypothetical protein QHI69_20490 [Burkholderia gladioli pv. gladioli]|nr:hypothetical protein [Burkholderia gladioli]MDJ1164262.1 hypothetical protein [Burkholderia gladioli pv. gladioli]QPQ84119.1 hypothetical protein I6H08_03265 [Burkholderia gladioli]